MADAAAQNSPYQPLRAPRGAALSCKGWPQEAVLRMLTNSLDPDVTELPQELLAKIKPDEPMPDRGTLEGIIAAIRALDCDETLIVRDGKPDGVVRTRADAPRVVAMDSHPALWDYIGPQGLLPAAHEFLAAAGRKYFAGGLTGKLVANCGMGPAGGALSLAAIMNGAAFLGVDADAEQIKRRVKTGYCDVMVSELDEALRILKNAVRKREPASVGLVADPVRLLSEMANRGVVPDLLVRTEFPAGESGAQAAQTLESLGTVVIADADAAYRASGREDGAAMRCIALSGELSDVQRIDKILLEVFPADEDLNRFLRIVQRRVRQQGLPARACWLDAGEQRKLGAALDEAVARGELRAPVVIVRDDAFGIAAGLVSRDGTTAGEKSFPLSKPGELDDLLKESRGSAWIAVDENGPLPRIAASAIVADGMRSSSVEHAFD